MTDKEEGLEGSGNWHARLRRVGRAGNPTRHTTFTIVIKKCIGEYGTSITEILSDSYSLLPWIEGRRHCS